MVGLEQGQRVVRGLTALTQFSRLSLSSSIAQDPRGSVTSVSDRVEPSEVTQAFHVGRLWADGQLRYPMNGWGLDSAKSARVTIMATPN